MARSVTAQTIIRRARRAADKEGDLGFVTDAELLDHLDGEAWPRLHALHSKAYPERYRKVATVTTDGVAYQYALPSDWFGTIAVDYQETTTSKLPLALLQEEERNIFNGVASGIARAYRVITTNLELYPTPPANQTYLHIYLPTATTISSVSTSIDGILGHEEILVLDLAIYILDKEESDSRALTAKREALLLEVQEEAQMRSVMEPRHIQDVGTSGRIYDPADYWPGRRGWT